MEHKLTAQFVEAAKLVRYLRLQMQTEEWHETVTPEEFQAAREFLVEVHETADETPDFRQDAEEEVA